MGFHVRYSNTTDLIVVGLGEVLWDELPGGRRLGGAPANFAVMASRLGVRGVIASRLGHDEPGAAARALLATLPVDGGFLQEDPERATGTVSVVFTDGQPGYIIHAPAAWDALELTAAWRELAGRADAVCWGTLAQRDAQSEETIHEFLAATRPGCMRLYDVNFREPFVTAATVARSLEKATVLKLNDGEMPRLLSLCGLQADVNPVAESDSEREAMLRAEAERLLSLHANLELVAITLGAHGSLLVTREAALRHRGIPATVVDTIGAGDAFTAALAVHRLQRLPLAVQSEAANRWGAWVAGQAGAMPELPPATLRAMEEHIRQAGGNA